jgi:hypothetical protein
VDHHLARLAKVVYVHPWCRTGTNDQIDVGKNKA